MTRIAHFPARVAAAALFFALSLPAAGPAAAQSWLSAQGLTVTGAGTRIAVGWRPEAAEQHYWCAAGAFATAQGVAQTARLARLDTPTRFTDPTFSTDPADIRAGGADRWGKSATGLFTFPRGNSLSVGFAASLCEHDNIASADD